MAQIKNFQTGKYSALSQRILNEIAAAKVSLLHPEKRAYYDKQLRKRLEEESKPAPRAAAPAAAKPKVKSASGKPEAKAARIADAAIPRIESASVCSYLSKRKHTKRSWQIPVALGVAALLLVGLVVFLLSRDGTPVEDREPRLVQSQPGDSSSKSPSPAERVEPDPADTESAAPEPEDTPIDPQDPPVEPPPNQDTTPPEEDPGRLLADLIDPVDPSEPGFEEPPGPAEPQSNALTRPKRLPVPNDEARQAAERQVRDVFRKEFAAAKTSEQKLALAKRLSGQAVDSSESPAVRFGLLWLARGLAADAAGVSETMEAVDRIGQYYEVDVPAMKAGALDEMIKSARTGPGAAALNSQIADTAVFLAESAVGADDFETAARFLKLAGTAARKADNPALVRRLTLRERELGRLKARFAAVKAALEVLAENPADDEANLTAGYWFCFVKGNWDKGLPMLRDGADPKLAKLAQQDIESSDDPRDQMGLADRWWDLSEKESSFAKPGAQSRAAYWYEKALPKLAGLDKVRVENRLKAITAAAESSGSSIGGVVQKGNVALATNGTTVSGVSHGASNLLDGNSTRYTGSSGIAYGTFPCEWTITFAKVYRLREIRFLLYDLKKDRFFKYAIATSPDGNHYTPLVDRSKGKCSGWQEISFPSRPVKSIKLLGLYGSAWGNFYVVEFEAYCIPPPRLPR